jgi:hypothetical protein
MKQTPDTNKQCSSSRSTVRKGIVIGFRRFIMIHHPQSMVISIIRPAALARICPIVIARWEDRVIRRDDAVHDDRGSEEGRKHRQSNDGRSFHCSVFTAVHVGQRNAVHL